MINARGRSRGGGGTALIGLRLGDSIDSSNNKSELVLQQSTAVTPAVLNGNAKNAGAAPNNFKASKSSIRSKMHNNNKSNNSGGPPASTNKSKNKNKNKRIQQQRRNTNTNPRIVAKRLRNRVRIGKAVGCYTIAAKIEHSLYLMSKRQYHHIATTSVRGYHTIQNIIQI